MNAMWICLCMCACVVLTQAQLEPKCPEHAACQANVSEAEGEHKFTVDGNTVSLYQFGEFFQLSCDEDTEINSPALPRYTANIKVRVAAVKGCTLPSNGSVVDALAALNISLLLEDMPCELELELTRPPALSAAHLAGLHPLSRLYLRSWNDHAETTSDFLSPLSGLKDLDVLNTRLASDSLEHITSGIVNLTLCRTGVQLPDSVFELRDLRNLEVIDSSRVVAPIGQKVGRVPNLRTLKLESVTVDLPAILSPSLEKLTLGNWEMFGSTHPLSRCDSLEELTLTLPFVSRLPSRWVAACPRLRSIKIETSTIHFLPKELLVNATELTDFQMSFGVLRKLPDDLLHYTPKLKYLNLRRNLLKSLPSGIFATSGALRILDLSFNKLEESALDQLAGLIDLVELYLGDLHFGDFCISNQGYSKLHSLTKLKKLYLAFSNITTICKDWRLRMPELRWLDLTRTSISHLGSEDLEFNRIVDSTVALYGTPVTGVTLAHADYADYTEEPSNGSGPRVTVELVGVKTSLHCDCSMYWTWLAHTRDPKRLTRNVSVKPLLCGPKPFRDLRLLTEEELMCELGPDVEQCEPCACSARPDDLDPQHRHLRLDCENKQIGSAPRAWTHTDSVDLLLAHNNITQLRIDDLPDKFRILDLRSNSIESFDERVIEAMVAEAVKRRVYISSNPLKCDCNAARWVSVLQARAVAAPYSLPDFNTARCADGRLLHEVALTITPCS